MLKSNMPATPSELAKAYLRNRDVRCPGCGRNRRNGGSARCTACGCDLCVTSDLLKPLELRPRDGYLLTGGVLTLAGVVVPAIAMNFARGSVLNQNPSVRSWDVPSAAIALLFFAGAVAALFAIVRLRRRHPASGGTIAMSVGFIMAGLSVPVTLEILDFLL